MGKEKVLPKYLNNDFLFDKAEHFELASETARVALAPNLFYFHFRLNLIKFYQFFFGLLTQNL